MKKAVITGISGQDGAYLARLLLEQGYSVCGTSRDAQISPFTNLQRLGIRDQVQVESVALNDFRSVIQVLFKVQPDEIYHLAGQSSVSLSFQQPVETQESVYVATLNLLEAIRFTGKKIRFYNASSSECFGDTHGVAADEETPFRPRSPYAVAKSAASCLLVVSASSRCQREIDAEAEARYGGTPYLLYASRPGLRTRGPRLTITATRRTIEETSGNALFSDWQLATDTGNSPIRLTLATLSRLATGNSPPSPLTLTLALSRSRNSQ